MTETRYGVPKNITKQGIFNKVWRHFIVDKGPRGVGLDKDGCRACLYRAPNGAACAVGVCLRDDEVPADDVRPAERWLPKHLHKHAQFLCDLQVAHDSYGAGRAIIRTNRRRMAAAFRKVARVHGLKVPGGVR
jgi:hypothetical protein